MTKLAVVCPPCLHCGGRETVLVEENAYYRFVHGQLAQDAFPEWPKEQRELLIAGTHPACWEQMFPPEDELPDTDECPLLITEMNAFLDDPMTAAVGDTSDLGRLLVSMHRKRHGCDGVMA